MAKELRRNMSYNGTMCGPMDVSGHMYDKVSVNGDLSVSGDLDCNRLVVNGTFSDQGTLKTKSGSINGNAVVNGGLEATRMTINGELDVDGDANIREVKIRGTINSDGSMISDKIDLLGNINVRHDCNSETFISRGVFVIGGLLNANNIDINLFGKCRVKEIGGETIKIKRMQKELFNRLLKYIVPEFDFEGHLETDTIEGDDIYVEYTTAKIVRGNNVVIGRGCDIGLVEYKNSFEQHKSSQIKEHVKTGN
jgi:cytoskeletal protein CcmA (bactofilin family)